MLRRLHILLAIAAIAGCTGGGGEDDGAATMASRAGSFGVVEVERSLEPDADERRATLGAVFARYEGVEGQQVLHLLGVGRPVAGLDACAVVGADPAALPEPSAAVDLLDAGTLEVRVAGSEAELGARTFPELGSLVAGVFYAEDAQLAPAVPNVDEYHIASSGTDEVPAFDVVVVPPPGFSDVLVDGRSPTEAPVVRRDDALQLLWDAGDPRDRVDLRLASGGQLVECVARDDGAFEIPRDVLSQLDADGGAHLVLRRVRSQRFDAGVQTAWVDVASTRTLSIAVR